jgi:FkbM family methyltransferase
MKQFAITILDALLPRRVKNSIMHLSYHLARAEFDYFAHRYCIAPNMTWGLKTMAARGFNPRTVIDIGAYEGEWSVTAQDIWPSSKVIMVEPNSEKTAKLQAVAAKLNGEVFVDLLGATNGKEVQFNVMETGSSVMSERSEAPRKIETRALRTLDSLALDVDAPGLLKIDAQGYELEILRGSNATLKQIEAVLLEVAVIEINEGAPLLHEVVAFMKERNFVAAELADIHRRPLDGALSQIDVIFVRENSKLLTDRRFFTSGTKQ